MGHIRGNWERVGKLLPDTTNRLTAQSLYDAYDAVQSPSPPRRDDEQVKHEIESPTDRELGPGRVLGLHRKDRPWPTPKGSGQCRRLAFPNPSQQP